MTLCANCHVERPTRAYAYALGHRRTRLCDECLVKLTAMGLALTLVDERVADAPVARERRRWIAPWTRRNLARDESRSAA